MNTDEIPRKSTILVIGANSTIGIAMVREFINHGDVVIATFDGDGCFSAEPYIWIMDDDFNIHEE